MELRQVIPDSNHFIVETKGGQRRFRPRPQPVPRGVNTNTLPPFLPVLGTDDGGESYYVTVTPGVVFEVLLAAGEDVDAVFPWTCPAQYDGGTLAKLPIDHGEAVFVRVRETENGNIGATSPDEPVDIVVADKDTVSLNYIPGVQAGVYYYKLAALTIADGVPTLAIIRGGSHIDRASGLTGDFLLEACDGDEYEEPPLIPTLILRGSFLSGHLVGLNLSESTRPLSPNTVREQIAPCT